MTTFSISHHSDINVKVMVELMYANTVFLNG
jgi:hypothetical protein